MATRPVTTSDILDGHVTLDVECLDRIYLNGYVPNLQVAGQVVQFLAVRGVPDPVAGGGEPDRGTLRDAVRTFATANHIPVVRFAKGDRKIAVMQRYVKAQETTGRSGPGWPRSGWRRSSNGCSRPVPSVPAAPPARARRVPCWRSARSGESAGGIAPPAAHRTRHSARSRRRRTRGHARILGIGVCAVLAGARSFTAISEWARELSPAVRVHHRPVAGRDRGRRRRPLGRRGRRGRRLVGGVVADRARRRI